MNWFQKLIRIGETKRWGTFFLFDEEIVFTDKSHVQFLMDEFGMSSLEAEQLRFLIPRGRYEQNEWKCVIEASPELEPYKGAIMVEYKLTPWDRPEWDFNDVHYSIYESRVQELASDPVYRSDDGSPFEFSPGGKLFLRRYAPNLLSTLGIS